jgi:hypothetical protein
MCTEIVIVYYSITVFFCASLKKVVCKHNMCIISSGYVFLILDTYHHDILYMNNGVRISGYISRRKMCPCGQSSGPAGDKKHHNLRPMDHRPPDPHTALTRGIVD